MNPFREQSDALAKQLTRLDLDTAHRKGRIQIVHHHAFQLTLVILYSKADRKGSARVAYAGRSCDSGGRDMPGMYRALSTRIALGRLACERVQRYTIAFPRAANVDPYNVGAHRTVFDTRRLLRDEPYMPFGADLDQPPVKKTKKVKPAPKRKLRAA